MRNTKKTIAAGTVLALGTAGVAYAYWSTTGSGTGSGSTTAGDNAAATVTNDGLAAMYPGDSVQDLVVKVTNTSTSQQAYVSGVQAWVTTDKANCDGSNFLLNGAAAPSAAAEKVALVWTAREINAGATAAQATGNTIQFNNKAAEQNACKGAAVTVHYTAS